MHRGNAERSVAVALCAVLVGSCAARRAEEAPDAATPPSRAGATLAREIDLDVYVERSRRAFLPQEGGFVGGGLEYRVRADEQGVALVVHHAPPGHAPRVSAPHALHHAVADRGGERLGARRRPLLARQSDGTLRIDHGWGVERLENRREGVVQSWTFERAPAGSGDLRLRIATSGLMLAARDGGGLHLAQPGSELGISYGHATWIDEDGQRFPIEARWREGERQIELVVPEPVLARTRWPAVLDPVLGPEVGPGVRAYGVARRNQLSADVAVGTGGSVVVWSDERTGTRNIFANRLSTAAAPLDEASVAVWISPNDSYAPAIAFGGGLYLIVWNEGTQILGRRMAPDGAFADATPITIATAPTGTAGGADVVFDGTDFVVAWSMGAAAEHDLYAARVTTGGALRDPTGVVVSESSGIQSSPSLAFDGTAVQIVWRDGRTDTSDVYGARFSGGTVLDPGGVPLVTGAGYQGSAGVTSGAGVTLLVWNDGNLGAIAVAPLDATGRLVPSGTRTLATGAVYEPIIASHPSGHLVAWHVNGSSSDAVRARPLDASGIPTGSEQLLRSASQVGTAAMAFDGTGYLIAGWVGTGTALIRDADVFVTRTSTAGTPWRTETVSLAGQAQLGADVAESGGHYLLVWQVDRGAADGVDVFGIRIGADGTVVDTTPLPLATGSGNQYSPAVGGDGLGGWLVVYNQDRPAGGGSFVELRSLVVSSSGTVGGARDLATGGIAHSAAIAEGPAGYLVVWEGGLGDIHGQRVGSSGGALGARITIASSARQERSPAAAWDGSGWQVVWSENAIPDEIRGARVSSTGVVGTATTLLAEVDRNLRDPSIAFGGGVFLLTAMSQSYGFQQAIRARRVDGAGAPLGSVIDVTTSYAAGNWPSVVHEGTDFFVAFHRAAAGGELQGARITSAGTVTDLDGVTLVEGAYGPQLASTGDGRALLAYGRFDADPAANTNVARARIVDFTRSGDDPDGTPCSSSWTCASGFCVDGVCCDGACGAGARDCQVCDAASGASADGSCTVVPAGLECRAARSVCDVAEVCDGSMGACPADAFVAAGTSCGELASDVCDVDDVCTGSSAFCATGAREPAGTLCRAAVGPCDAEERCDGTGAACPVDGLADPSVVCRPSAGACDVAESCDGASSTCPPDTFTRAGAVCRPLSGDCDVEETCDGRTAACPEDGFRAAGASCRFSRGGCDPPERCSGAGPRCPPDRRLPAGEVCRPAAGECDREEVCDGRSESCPADTVEDRGTICREAGGACDVAEACDGVSALCSVDRTRRDGASCDDGLTCNGLAVCRAGTCIEAAPPMCAAPEICDELVGECARPSSAGCGCRTPAGGSGGGAWLLLALVGWLRHRRKQ